MVRRRTRRIRAIGSSSAPMPGLNEQELEQFKPTLVYLNEQNRITRTGDAIPIQAA